MIRFSKYIWLYTIVSGMVLVPGIYSLIRFGLRPSIDFTGGTLVEIRFDKAVTQSSIEEAAGTQGLELASLQRSADRTYLLRMKPETDETLAKFHIALEEITASKPQLVRNETVGPVLGGELLQKSFIASIVAISGILLYIAWAFKSLRYGLSAVVALFHDLLVVVGAFSVMGKLYGVEVDTLFITAVLTTMSFSVHDTIVVFDRIREYRRRNRNDSLAVLSDQALTETMNRSITNSMTIVFTLLALLLMGGASVKWFVVALLIGTVSGTYSSPFVATPVLILLDRWERGGDGTTGRR